MKDIGINGRLVALFLIVMAYLVYYSELFPELLAEQQKLFWIQREMAPNESDVTRQCKIAVSVKIPRNMIDYQENELVISIINQDNKEICEGTILLAANLIDEDDERLTSDFATFRVIDKEKTPFFFTHNIRIVYKLEPYDSLVVPVHVQISTRVLKEVEFVFFQIEKEHEISLANPLLWGGNPTCDQDRDKYISPNRICSVINDDGVFRQNAVENLLLPPWSNGVLPILVISLVWLAENSMVGCLKKKDNSTESFHVLKLLAVFFVSFVFLSILYVSVDNILLDSDGSMYDILWALSKIILIALLLSHACTKIKQFQEVRDIQSGNDNLTERANNLAVEIADRIVQMEKLRINNIVSVSTIVDSSISSSGGVSSRKSYRCTECGEIFYSENEPEKCPTYGHEKGFDLIDPDSSQI
jgi:hypothetical protein